MESDDQVARRLKMAELALALALNAYILWLILPDAWTSSAKSWVATRRAHWRADKRWESDQAHMRFEMYLLRSAAEVYAGEHGNLTIAGPAQVTGE